MDEDEGVCRWVNGDCEVCREFDAKVREWRPLDLPRKPALVDWRYPCFLVYDEPVVDVVKGG